MENCVYVRTKTFCFKNFAENDEVHYGKFYDESSEKNTA